MEQNYMKHLLTLDAESLLDAVYFAEGNEHLFWIAVTMFYQSENNFFTDHMCNLLFDAAKREIEGLYFVGYMDRAHETILSQYGIKPVFD